jgi:uncharacterized protein
MHFFGEINLLYSLAGLLVGTLVGLTGVGGGSLMTPILVLMFGFHPATAVGTDLLYASMTKSVGSVVHGWRDSVDWNVVLRLASGSVPMAIVTVVMLKNIGSPSEHARALITSVLGVMLLMTSVAVVFQARLVAFMSMRLGTTFARDRVWPTTLLGAILGVLVSVSSVGAGAVGVTALLILYPHLPVSRIVGSDIAHAVPLTLVAGTGHWMIGDVNMPLLLSLLVGSIPGVIVGSHISSRASNRLLQPLLAGVLLVVGLKLLL